METLALHAVLFDDYAGAPDDLAGVALPVDLAQSRPRAEDLAISDLDQVDLVLSTEGLDELDVLGFRASLDEHAEMGLALVQSLRALAETAGKPVVNERVFQNLLRTDGNYQ